MSPQWRSASMGIQTYQDVSSGPISRIIAATPRLWICEWNANDVDDYAELVGDGDVMRFIGEGTTRTRDRAAREIEGFIAHERQHGFSRWAAFCRRTGIFIGMVGFMYRNDETDFGGRMHRRF